MISFDKLCSKNVAPIFTLTSNVWETTSSHISLLSFFSLFKFAYLVRNPQNFQTVPPQQARVSILLGPPLFTRVYSVPECMLPTSPHIRHPPSSGVMLARIPRHPLCPHPHARPCERVNNLPHIPP